MSDKSKIEWTESTWNPITGCTKVSPGCKFCYAERDWVRLSAPRPKPNIYTGRKFTDVQCHPERLEQPLRWRKPRRIFVNSMSDLFHESVPDEFIDKIFAVMALAPQHTFQVLTKRPDRMRDYMVGLKESDFVRASGAFKWAGPLTNNNVLDGMRRWRAIPVTHSKYCDTGPLPNVWLGVSVEDQETADERIPLLLQTPAAVRWLSMEPLLGLVDISDWLSESPYLAGMEMAGADNPQPIDWVVVGGESGPKARPTHPDWVRSLRDQCEAANVPFFFKQWGEWEPVGYWLNVNAAHNHIKKPIMVRVGKKAAGRVLDGQTHNEYPTGEKQ